MTEKKIVELPELSREVADALSTYLDEYGEDVLLQRMYASHHKKFVRTEHQPLNTVSRETLAKAALIGYTVEDSPEEKVRAYYEESERTRGVMYSEPEYDYFSGVVDGIEETLDLLGVKIPGVNVEEAE
ncbi:hypothetical protein FDG96_gp42 [Bacillus phage Mgbh1]|uniref:Uncharacterized protein n=1 Tax=Bacillus phage Mgbh1 TaxID=1796993 RepID=A0A142F1P4_9CAUD|nr:hypothetical protein FDG96_gp42 [Bacillus phage Mgbh1]AMQ66701.1 hypothetical protein [Bacillus phage Mgbh1]